MKNIVVLLLMITGFSCVPSGKLLGHVEKTYFLKGTIGQQEMAVKMLCYDEMPTRYSHYFFQNDKRDREMSGKLEDGLWHFVSVENEGNNNIKPTSTMNIAESGNGSWKGTWTDSLGKSWEIVLHPIISDSVSIGLNNLLQVNEMDPYERYRVSNIHFIKTKSEKLTNMLEGDWYQEQETGISFFRLRSLTGGLKTDSVNTTLEGINLSLIENYFRSGSHQKNTRIETNLLYLTSKLISFQIVSTATTITGKTLQTRQSSTLDIANGESVNLEDIIWFDKNEPAPLMSDLYKIYKYRKNVFAPKVFEMLQQLYPQKMKNDSCDINKVESWALPVWSLTNKGMALSIRASDTCNQFTWVIIPYKKLAPFMGKKYSLK